MLFDAFAQRVDAAANGFGVVRGEKLFGIVA